MSPDEPGVVDGQLGCHHCATRMAHKMHKCEPKDPGQSSQIGKVT